MTEPMTLEQWGAKIAAVNAAYEDAKAGDSERAINDTEYTRYETLLAFQHWWEARAERTIAARSGEPTNLEEVQAEFTDYFARNYPGPNTIISNPLWHAPKVFRAATFRLVTQLASLTAERDAAREEFSEWLDASRKALDAHAAVVAERDAARAELARIFAARERFTSRAHDPATREVLTRFNFAPFTDCERTVLMAKEIVALQARCADRDRLAACVERVRGCDRVECVVDWGNEIQFEEPQTDGPYMRAADILAALEGTNV